MADQYSVFNPTVDLNPYAAQIADIQRRQRMAQLLQQQGMEPIESQVVGNRVIPISPWQILAKGLQAGMGAYQERQANQAAQDLQDQIQYNQRSQEAENAAAQQAIAGRLFGERYTPPAKTPDVDYDHQLGGTPMPEKPSTLQVSPSATFAPRSIEEAGQQTRAADQLGEITPTATYRYDPKGALSIAMTPEGQQALQKNQMLASMLAQSMAKPDLTKFYGQIKAEDFTPESRAAFDQRILSGQTPDYSILQKNPEKPQTTSLQHTTTTYYDKNGNEIKQEFSFNPVTGALTPITKAYSGKPAEKKDIGQQMTPEALSLAVDDVAAHPENIRNYASFGSAGQENRIAINNGIAAKLKESGMSNDDLLKLRVSAKNNVQSSAALQKQANAVDAFENLAKANGQRVLDLIDKLDKTGVPLTEGLLRSAANKLGSADAAELQSTLTTFQQETGRILSNPNMTGVVSDSARSEIQHMVPANMSAAQARRVINRLFTEMDLRKQYTQDALSSAVNRTVAFPQNNPAPGVNAAPPAASTGAAAGTAPNIQSLLDKYSGKK